MSPTLFEVPGTAKHARSVATVWPCDCVSPCQTHAIFKLRSVGAVRASDRSRSFAVSSSAIRADLIGVETNEAEEFRQKRSDETIVAKKRKSALTKEFRAYLEVKGHDVKRYRLTVPSSVSPLFTDEFDLTDGILYEAKSSASR